MYLFSGSVFLHSFLFLFFLCCSAKQALKSLAVFISIIVILYNNICMQSTKAIFQLTKKKEKINIAQFWKKIYTINFFATKFEIILLVVMQSTQ